MKKQKQLKTYDSKFVDFLTGHNVVEINSQLELTQLRNICASIGLSMFAKEPLVDLMEDIWRNEHRLGKSFITEPLVVVEYNNSKGFCIYRETKEKLVDWFGSSPITIDTLCKELSIEKL